ncbi:MAG: YaiI/YqxD family protein [Sulfuritalea sp.]|nr:YaiI/YqxD family protein [Sulfuritalea sp.]
MHIWVDADACPGVIKDILYRAAKRHSLPVILVANQWLRVPPSPWIRSVQVPKGFDVADNHIVEQAAAGDLVVTADIPLAALVIEKRAFALNPRGEFYTAENIRQVLDMRNFMDTLRSSGVDTGGPPTFSHADRQSFANQLDRFIAGRLRPAGPNAPA